jgi:hypothetical protein
VVGLLGRPKRRGAEPDSSRGGQWTEDRGQTTDHGLPNTDHRLLITDYWPKAVCRAGAVVLLVGFWFDGGLFKLATAAPFWILLELGRNEQPRKPRMRKQARETHQIRENGHSQDRKTQDRNMQRNPIFLSQIFLSASRLRASAFSGVNPSSFGFPRISEQPCSGRPGT